MTECNGLPLVFSSLGRNTDYEYDYLGRRTRLTEDGGGIVRYTAYIYDDTGRPWDGLPDHGV